MTLWRIGQVPGRRGQRSCPFCHADLDDDRTCRQCGDTRQAPAPSGWRPDPTARHEGRYYLTERPTNRVRDGKARHLDPIGGAMLPNYLEMPPVTSSIRTTWLATAAVTAIVVMSTVVLWALLVADRNPPPAPDAGYLSSLRDGGVFNQFTSESQAVGSGHRVCRELEDGAAQQGVLAGKLAVDAYCPQFAKDYRVLDTATASGVFALTDESGTGAIESDRSSCRGAGGYTDIDRSTPVTVTSDRGAVLAVTALGAGRQEGAVCKFSFEFPVTEGEKHYIVAVGRRGNFTYTFAQLRSRQIQLQLGH